MSWNAKAVMPVARMLTAVPETIWSARRWIAKIACTRASSAPKKAAPTSPSSHEPSLSAHMMPKNAPVSIMPSRPMLTTPARSEIRPPSAPKVSGVAYWSVPAKRPAVTIATTVERCAFSITKARPAPTMPVPMA